MREPPLAQRHLSEEILFQESRATLTLARARGRVLPPHLLEEAGSQISGVRDGHPRFFILDGATREISGARAPSSASLMEEAQRRSAALLAAMERWESAIARSGLHVEDAAIEATLSLSSVHVARRESANGGSWTAAPPRVRASLEARVTLSAERDGRHRTIETATWAPVPADPSADPFAARPDPATECLRRCEDALRALPPPAMEAPALFTPAAAGVLLHEICGHLLEADLIVNGVSPFAACAGAKIAPADVTLVDDPLLEGARVHLPGDDEAEPARAKILIENGVLAGFLSDRATSAATGGRSTGNARRETYRHPALPRMTNLVLSAGERAPEDLLKRIGRGLLVERLGRGRVDPRRGQFRLEVECGRLVEDGSAGRPVAGAFLIGSCRDLLASIDGIGSDLEVDSGAGLCIKEDQIVPVGSASPSVYVSKVRVLPGAVP